MNGRTEGSPERALGSGLKVPFPGPVLRSPRSLTDFFSLVGGINLVLGSCPSEVCYLFPPLVRKMCTFKLHACHGWFLEMLGRTNPKSLPAAPAAFLGKSDLGVKKL